MSEENEQDEIGDISDKEIFWASLLLSLKAHLPELVDNLPILATNLKNRAAQGGLNETEKEMILLVRQLIDLIDD